MGDGFVATLGTAVTPAQVRLLGQRFKKVTFLFDPEPEAQGKARKVGAQLAAMGTEVELIDLELPRDPGDLSPRKAAYLRQELGL
jgi:DNA primase